MVVFEAMCCADIVTPFVTLPELLTPTGGDQSENASVVVTPEMVYEKVGAKSTKIVPLLGFARLYLKFVLGSVAGVNNQSNWEKPLEVAPFELYLFVEPQLRPSFVNGSTEQTHPPFRWGPQVPQGEYFGTLAEGVAAKVTFTTSEPNHEVAERVRARAASAKGRKSDAGGTAAASSDAAL